MSKFVNKYKMKYQDYQFQDNKCVASSDIHQFQNNPSSLDQIEDVDFWNRAYNYTNIINPNNGEIIGLKGVCNPILINNCEKLGNNNKGICNVQDYINPQIGYISYKIPNNNFNPSYSNTDNNPSSTPSFNKLDTNTEIINDPNFASLYCNSGSLKEEGGKFLCS